MAPRLLRLDLSGCMNLTDEGVAKLGALTRLRSLRLAECLALTDKGAFPGCAYFLNSRVKTGF